MQTFVRTSMTGGVALIAASAIALSPTTVTAQQMRLPAIPVSSIAATLTASTIATTDPLTEWVQVLTTTFNNLAALGQQVQTDPAPILTQILTNQIGYVTTVSTGLANAGGSLAAGLTALPLAFLQAAQQLAAGQISAGLNTAFQAVVGLVQSPALQLIPLLDIPGQVLQNITNVVKAAPGFLVYSGLAVISTVNGVASAFEDTAQAVYNAVGAGDLGAAVNAIVNAPAALTDAFFNGYAPTGAVGILTPVGVGIPGLVGTLLSFRDVFAQALGAPMSSAAAAAMSPRAATVSPAPAATVTLNSTTATGTASSRTGRTARSLASTLRSSTTPSAAATKATPAAADNTTASDEGNAQPASTPIRKARSGAAGTGSSARNTGHAGSAR